MTGRIFILLFWLFYGSILFAQSRQDSAIDKLISQLQSKNWGLVSDAKESLATYGETAIPKLIEALNIAKDIKTPLIGTADLIYPGAKYFHGHGQFLAYDVDYLVIRLGWVIECISFKDFGFGSLNNSFARVTYVMAEDSDSLKWAESGINTNTFSRPIEEVNNWWNEHSTNWTQLNGFMDALTSKKITEQQAAINYLSNYNNCIKGLTRAYFETNIRSLLITSLNSTDEEIRTRSNSILKMADYKGSESFSNYISRCW